MAKTIARGQAKKRKSTNVSTTPLSLVDFMREERKAVCPVCALPEAVREQLRLAPEKKIKLVDRIKWLRRLGHDKIQDNDLTQHLNRRHDYANE